ncbi:MAG: hypothetical protein M1835_000538 [Candelina submexicana]|nr:MAG: hypothetical protein M1835_000538 [Candelina submexicana]
MEERIETDLLFHESTRAHPSLQSQAEQDLPNPSESTEAYPDRSLLPSIGNTMPVTEVPSSEVPEHQGLGGRLEDTELAPAQSPVSDPEISTEEDYICTDEEYENYLRVGQSILEAFDEGSDASFDEGSDPGSDQGLNEDLDESKERNAEDTEEFGANRATTQMSNESSEVDEGQDNQNEDPDFHEFEQTAERTRASQDPLVEDPTQDEVTRQNEEDMALAARARFLEIERRSLLRQCAILGTEICMQKHGVSPDAEWYARWFAYGET